jgi:allantoicase
MEEWYVVVLVKLSHQARFRAYGKPQAPALLDTLPHPSVEPLNLLSPLLSARIVACSDANFSPPGNLLLPGRGTDMSDGWETRRSQVNKGKYAPGGPLHGKERSEWVVARLAGTGTVSYVEVDTAYHPGNYPVVRLAHSPSRDDSQQACKVEAILSDKDLPGEEEKWTTIVDKKPLGAHRQHWFDRERTVSPTAVFSHVRLSIFPGTLVL